MYIYSAMSKHKVNTKRFILKFKHFCNVNNELCLKLSLKCKDNKIAE